jgi:hypothetical protein
MIFLKSILVFFVAFIIDWIWALYIISTSKKDPLKAAMLSGLILLFGATITLSYVENKWYLVPATAGGMLGTYICVCRKSREE